MKKRILYGLLGANIAVMVIFWWNYSGHLLTANPLLALGRLSGLLLALAALFQVFLISRVAWVERCFGFDRMVEAAQQLNLVAQNQTAATVLVTIFDQSAIEKSLNLAQTLRKADIPTELFPAVEKLEKQLKYADRKRIPFVIIQGPEEVKNKTVQLKNMKERTSKIIPVEEIVKELKGI